MDWKTPVEGKVHLKLPKPSHKISGSIPRTVFTWQRKRWITGIRSAVQDSSTGVLRTVQIKWTPGNEIDSAVVAFAAVIPQVHVAIEHDGKSAAGAYPSIQTPAI